MPASADDCQVPPCVREAPPPPSVPYIDPKKWRPTDPIPLGWHVDTRPHRALVITGTAILAAGTIGTVIIGASQIHQGGGFAFIPVVGPFIAAGTYHPPPCTGLCLGLDFTTPFYEGALYAFGVVEVAGAVLLVTGLAVKQEVLRPNLSLPVLPVPFVTRTASGLALAGTF
jgi:hypothetical protein